MIINPNLIPRFNVDYSITDFLCSINAAINQKEFDLSYLESIFGKKTFFFINSGRSALYLVLKAINLPKGSEVGVPLYSCPVVWEAIVKAGYIPQFIDIDLSTYTMDPKDLKRKVEKLSAVVVIHTFGHPADMDEIIRIANGIPIIEDCAHSLLSEYKNKKTGLFGDASIFTFGNGKYISAGGGGMILVNKQELAERLTKEVNNLDSPTLLQEILNSIKAFLHSFLYRKPWFGLFSLPLGTLLNKKDSACGKTNFKVTRIGKGNLAVFLRKLIIFEGNMKIQRIHSNFLINNLNGLPFTLFREKGIALSTYFLFPIRFPTREKRDHASKILISNGIDHAKYWEKYQIAEFAYGYNGDCPSTELCTRTLITIPNYYTLTNKELSKIIETMRSLV